MHTIPKTLLSLISFCYAFCVKLIDKLRKFFAKKLFFMKKSLRPILRPSKYTHNILEVLVKPFGKSFAPNTVSREFVCLY